MKKLFILFAVLSIASFLALGCRSAHSTGSAIKEGSEAAAKKVDTKTLDASITAAVKMKFANDETVHANNIDVDTSNGVVTLTGVVASQDEAKRAVQLAWTAEGVKDVRSNLTVQR